VESVSADIPLQHFLVLSSILFCLGVYGVLARRNAVLILMSVELMLNAVSINLVAFAVYTAPSLFIGIIFAIFVIAIAAAEVGLALAIVLRVFRNRGSANVDELDALKW
jgi:NADH:ubiquinone oxidoreductase subunit K